jgi:hypothetical protein
MGARGRRVYQGDPHPPTLTRLGRQGAGLNLLSEALQYPPSKRSGGQRLLTDRLQIAAKAERSDRVRPPQLAVLRSSCAIHTVSPLDIPGLAELPSHGMVIGRLTDTRRMVDG